MLFKGTIQEIKYFKYLTKGVKVLHGEKYVC